MTALKSLGLNLAMLLVAAGVLFWVLQEGPEAPSEQPVAAHLDQGANSPSLEASISRPEQTESEGDRPTASPATRAGSAKLPALRPVTFPLDLNTAKLEDFIELPGIGEKLAQRLVDYRQSHGGFRSVEDLRQVRGIGAKRFERLRPLVVAAAAP